MADPDFWELDEENVIVAITNVPAPVPACLPLTEGGILRRGILHLLEGGKNHAPGVDWSPSILNMTSFDFLEDRFLPYLWSCDLHLDVANPGGPQSHHPGVPNGLWVANDFIGSPETAFGEFSKCRRSAWKGVLTVPIAKKVKDILGNHRRRCIVTFVSTRGQETRGLRLVAHPEPGEDLGLRLGFDLLEFSSTSRNKGPDLFPAGWQLETITRGPDGEPYLETVVEPSERIIKPMQDAAERILLPQSLIAKWLPNAKVEVSPIYEYEDLEDLRTRGRLLGANFSSRPHKRPHSPDMVPSETAIRFERNVSREAILASPDFRRCAVSERLGTATTCWRIISAYAKSIRTVRQPVHCQREPPRPPLFDEHIGSSREGEPCGQDDRVP